MNDGYQDRDNDITIINQYVSSLVSNINRNTAATRANQALSIDTQMEQSVFRFAQEHQLKAKVISDWSELCDLTFPAVVKRSDGHYILVIRANRTNVLLFDQYETRTSIVPKKQFLALWSGHGVIFQYHPDNV
ncbi:MAG: cysteine peptidase family C39 domain-containing protein [Gammaproteobacteria bacterium]